MKNIIYILGGTLLAAAVVLLAVHVFQDGEVKSSFSEAASRETNSYEDYTDELAFEKAVTKHPVFTYQGSVTKKSGVSYDLTEDILLTDTGIDYKDTLKQAKADGIITKTKTTVTDSTGNETKNAVIDDSTGNVTFSVSGIYLVTVEGSDSDHNKTAVNFLISINKEKKGESQ